jgi:selenocysteine lyase/cysteine desulfurase
VPAVPGPGLVRDPTSLLAWRDEFPAVSRSVFLGTHTLAPLGHRARAAVERFLDAWQEKASAERLWFEDVIPEMRRLEALYARIIGADPDEVALTPSVSTGLSSLQSAVRFDGDRTDVVISADEFPADSLVWLAAEARGARVVPVTGRSVDAYLGAVGPRTAVVMASRVSYLDGAVLDVDALAAGCRDAGALLVLDDYHGSGVVPVDVHANGCDALVGGPLKYLLGGPGVAFLYVRADRTVGLRPTVTGWFAQADFFAFDGSAIAWPDTAQRFAMGTPAPASIFAAAAGLEIVLEVGVDRIRARVLELTDHLVARAAEAGLVVRTPVPHAERGGMVAIEVPDSKAVLTALLAEGVVVDERHGALRVAPHFFSTEEDVDALFAALRRLGVVAPLRPA